jgi:hypothetical protein
MFIHVLVFKLAFFGTVVIAPGGWIWVLYVGLKRLIKLWPGSCHRLPYLSRGSRPGVH